ncbi:MAG TPA: M20/M25/M40 family metallo-hydrolase [Longimicrobium sp.]
MEGAVVAVPEGLDSIGFRRWLAGVRGKFVLVTPPVTSCRPRSDWQQWGSPNELARVESDQREVVRRWVDWVTFYTKRSPMHLPELLADAGAAGLLLNAWTGGWGTERVQAAPGRRLPAVNLSCEDYGLLSRLAANAQGPVIRMEIDAAFAAEVPAINTLAEIRGRERPQEYVVLSAHFDSWDAASGATDNGTGSVLMMEAMRILRKHHPRPRRTILLGLWGGEEQGLNGSRAFVADHPAVVQNIHVVLNQDSGTGQIEGISMEGFTEVGPYFRRWLSVLPGTSSSEIRLTDPGLPSTANTDHASFVCAGVPAFNLSSRSWGYQAYTWHTNRDTYDKIVFANLRRNAALVAMLAYLAAEEPELLPRTFDPEPIHPTTGVRMRRARCSPPARKSRDVDHDSH